jgi:polygalacturonase
MFGKLRKKLLLFAVVCLGPATWMHLAVHAAAAQDTRVVTEPNIPKTCHVLFARQTSGDIRGNDYRPEKLDTARIQQALDTCAPDHSVELAAESPAVLNGPTLNAFVTGPLLLRDGVTLHVDAHVTLYGSRNPRVYDYPDPDARPGRRGRSSPPGKCGTREPRALPGPTVSMRGTPRPVTINGCRPLISASFVKNAGVMGEGTIDGRGYGRLFGESYSWWQLARAAEPKDDRYYSVKLIVADHADNFTLYGIHLVNSPNYHVVVAHTNGFTAWDVHLQTPVVKRHGGGGDDDGPKDGPVDARNTDGIDPGTSENITVAHSWIDNGDDNIAVKQGVKHMSVIDNHFYNGHGMSVGSETALGQSFLLVDGLTEDHTTSGIRIKSNVTRGGPVHDLTYRNVCMKDVAIPIAISPYYTNMTVDPFEDPKYEGFRIPDYKAITLKNVFANTPGDVLIAGLNDEHRTGVTLDNVHITGIRQTQVHLAFDDFVLIGNGANFKLTGKNVSVKETRASETPEADPCAGKFLPYR